MTANFRRTVSQNPRTIKGREFNAIVVSEPSDDPEKNERVRVRIKGLHDDLKDDELPWQSVNRGGSQANGGSMGSIGPIPPKGTAVKVKFADDTMYHGSYSATSTGDKQQSSELYQGEDTTGKDYGHVTSSVDSSGNRITTNNKRDTFDYEHVSGTRVSIDGKGHMNITAASNKVGKDGQEKNSQGFTLHITGPVNIRSTESVNIGSDKDINIIAEQNVNISAKGKFRIIAKGAVNMEGSTVDINDGSGQNPGMNKLPTPPARTRPTPKVSD